MSDSERLALLAEALRRADYMNWTAAELAARLNGFVERTEREAVATREAELRDAVRAEPNPFDEGSEDVTEFMQSAGFEKARAAVLRLLGDTGEGGKP